MPKVSGGGARRAGSREGLEEKTHAFLNLLVGIERDAAGMIVHEANGQWTAQLASAGLVEDAAAQT